ncbi:Ankyrin repeat domain-containing 45 [Brachionus plicatilis]|uniref:Ankyrin repeat domain-containing 45 n=1 Tax=Brachionus plicatilis TaxID=10195 RepID=A0A3M7ST15_BRAPC|nr:Ankyrin repeat domain-containing 45 [Brachionus plicatilis]
MTSTPNNKKKNNKISKEAIERFSPPDIETLALDENFVLQCALKNEYQSICGAFDAKEHPLASFIAENKLFDRRDEHGKTAFDLAAQMGNKEFIRAILLRTDEKIDENVFNLRGLLKPANSYNFLHYACIWGRLDLVKFLIEQQKLILDPSIDDFVSNSNATMQSTKSSSSNPNLRTLGSALLRSKTKTGETPRDLTIRYNHHQLLEYLNYAEKRQTFIDNINDVKLIASDSERNQNKFSKDDKKKLDKVYAETMDWLEKNKEIVDMEILETQIKLTEAEVKPILDKLTDINASNSNMNSGSFSNRSKEMSKA